MIPKIDPRYILFVQGKHRGLVKIENFNGFIFLLNIYGDVSRHVSVKIVFLCFKVGEIVQTESSKQQAVVQILRDKNITKSHYDDICEYTGDIHQE